MKHHFQTLIFLCLFFFVSQVVGLFVVSYDMTITTGPDILTPVAEYSSSSYIPPPPAGKTSSYWYIVAGILVGAALALVLIRFRLVLLWKLWYFLAVFSCLSVALHVFFSPISSAIIAFFISLLKLRSRHFLVQNAIEVFVYSGFSVVFVGWLDLKSGFILLALVSAYDAYAVWQSKHMIRLAEFSRSSHVSSGITVPTKGHGIGSESLKNLSHAPKSKVALLGGGDIGFVLIFSSVVMEYLATVGGLSISSSFLATLIISTFATVSLFVLLLKGEKNRFYPAMPFLSAGCISGFGVVWLLFLW